MTMMEIEYYRMMMMMMMIIQASQLLTQHHTLYHILMFALSLILDSMVKICNIHPHCLLLDIIDVDVYVVMWLDVYVYVLLWLWYYDRILSRWLVYFLCTILRVEPDGCCVDGCSVLDTMSTSSFAQRERRNVWVEGWRSSNLLGTIRCLGLDFGFCGGKIKVSLKA